MVGQPSRVSALATLAALLAIVPAFPVLALPLPPSTCTSDIVRSIQWGAGSGAGNVEGAAAKGGRTASVWDAFAASQPARIRDGSGAGERGVAFVERYKQDVALMKQLGLKHFRFSISWSRLLPGAKAGSPASPAGVAFYASLLEELEAAGIEPMVALHHWDLPQSLQDAYGGFLSPRIVDDYTHYAGTCFRLFGARVKRWLTFVEPFVICNQQYGNGQFAPGVDNGDRGRYACGHNLLLAHAAAAALYRRSYAPAQRGALSFSSLVTWPEPDSSAAADARAAQNKLDAEVGWFLDPILSPSRDYPASLRAAKGALLPRFSAAQQAALAGSLDFIAANAFTAKAVSAQPGNPNGWREARAWRNGTALGQPTGIAWMDSVPWSQARMLRYLASRYRIRGGLPHLVISSSGTQVPGEAGLRGAAALADGFRVSHYAAYLGSVCEAVASGDVRLLAWYAWSLLDSWEWTAGFSERWGLVHVDTAPGGSLARRPKDSARWLASWAFRAGAD